jgi:glyoxylase-like metal-dependent hydrolase (beta-lactamase superfamily II)
MTSAVEQVTTAHGARIYRIPLRLFPQMTGYAHLILDQGEAYLFDVGSGFGDSNDDLAKGLDTVREEFGDPIDWDDLRTIFISHGHIDHYGGLHFVRQHSSAPIVIHELERRILTDYEGRLKLIEDRLEAYLKQGGLPEGELEEVMGLYLLNKHLFSSMEVQATYEEIGMQAGRLTFEHVPGHCPGQVIAWLDDVLLASDHILKETSPHQAPECLSLNMGLEHYLSSLAQVLPRAHQVRWTLGGHEGIIEDLPTRIYEIAAVHRQRLNQILCLLDQPLTLFEISKAIFTETDGYHRLLALEEAGAHIEYLHTRGYITIVNDGSDDGAAPPVFRYTRTGGESATFPGMHIFNQHEPMQASNP